jgi:hypothetical protein
MANSAAFGFLLHIRRDNQRRTNSVISLLRRYTMVTGILRRGRSKSSSGIMTEKFYYIEFKFIPKKEGHIHRDAVVEVPKDLVGREQTQLMNWNRKEKKAALDLARAVALASFSTGAAWIAWPYDEDALWCDDRPSLMGERACDYEENGVRV